MTGIVVLILVSIKQSNIMYIYVITVTLFTPNLVSDNKNTIIFYCIMILKQTYPLLATADYTYKLVVLQMLHAKQILSFQTSI